MLSIALIIIDLPIYGQQDEPLKIMTDRPDLTESSRTLPKNSIQIETGFLMFVENPINTNEYQSTLFQLPTTLVRIGLFKNVELRLFNQFVNENNNDPSIPIKTRSTYGIDNLQLGSKINVTTEKGIRPEIALLSHFILPMGSTGFRNERMEYNLVFSFAHTLSTKFSLGYNIGWTTDYNNNKGTGLYTLALGYTISPKFGFYTEAYGIWPNLEEPTLGIDGGFTYLLKNTIQLDASAGKGISENNYFYSIGFSILIPEVF